MNVYYIDYNRKKTNKEIGEDVNYLFDFYLEKENIKLENDIPIKVHFGEKGNVTYIKPECYSSLIDSLENKQKNIFFIETNVLYKGQRQTRDNHIKLAKEHGFTDLPIIIADGDAGEEYTEVEINKKHFDKCLIGKEYEKYNQIIVMSHFKGHTLAGFGGAIKQLAMGFASRGGKLAQHVNAKPFIIRFLCIGCGACEKICPTGAISIKKNKSYIEKEKCTGCGSCMAKCPKNAIKVNYLSAIKGSFQERLSEYAYAANLGKNNIYISLAIDITKKCDCEGEKMQAISEDIGVFISSDPVAIDQACLDLVNKKNKKRIFKRGKKTLKYSQKINLGTTNYNLIQIER